MLSLRVRLAVLAAPVLLLGTMPAHADKPTWTPIAELLIGSLGKTDAVSLADVMTRCTALSMTLSGLTADFSPEMSQLYKDQANRFIEHSLRIESQVQADQSGEITDLEELSGATREKLKTMVIGYSDWMDDNMEAGGSLFDREIEMEIDSCHLATRLVSQLSYMPDGSVPE
ncbi:MAG TPA: hypothetical protein VNR18_03545 [Hyphomicrobiales bacterium]|nr:hypothetical protein [Hyphomicrobiales bacterium]